MTHTSKQPKDLVTTRTATSLQEKRPEKAKDKNFKMNPNLANGDSEARKS